MRRVIDANLNRAREGIRVLEDVARFVLNDAGDAARLKEFRHSLGAAAGESLVPTLSSRDAAGDVTAFLNPTSEQERDDLRSLVVANAKRTQESLRVLEEFAKLPPDAGSVQLLAVAKQIRFAMYDMEKNVVSKLLRQEKAGRIRGLYVIVDCEMIGDRSELEVTRLAIEGGAQVIQLRDKRGEKGRTLTIARQLRELCAKTGTLFVVNDHPDVAVLAKADGVHVGQKDLPVSEVRKLVPVDMLVGCSTAYVEEARKAIADGADHLGVGAMFPTSTKLNTRPAGLASMVAVREAVKVPLVGIGGINAENASQVMAAGADAVAVISAIVLASDVRLAAASIASAIKRAD